MHEKIFLLVILSASLIGTLIVSNLTAEFEYYMFNDDIATTSPLVEQFIIPYQLYYFFILIPIMLLWKNKIPLRKTILSYMFTVFVSNIIYLAYPVKMLRPIIVEQNFFLQTINFLYQIDPPFNTFPSMHVSLTFLALLILRKYERKLSYYLLPIAILIIMSTIFIKQHYYADIVGGLILGGISYYVLFKPKISVNEPKANS